MKLPQSGACLVSLSKVKHSRFRIQVKRVDRASNMLEVKHAEIRSADAYPGAFDN